MHYTFYFDETFHDRKITVKPSGVINTFTENKNDSYIGVFWGIDHTRSSVATRKLHILENKYREKFGLNDEFKSTTIAKKNFTYGIRSFGKDAMAYYRDLFTVLDHLSPIIHVNAVSKIEYLVRHIFDVQSISFLPGVSSKAFYYSITKFILTYHSPALIQALYESAETADHELFRNELINHLEEVIYAIGGIPRKQREYDALHQLHMLVSLVRIDSGISTKYDFVYYQNFDGLNRLLAELKISPSRVNLVIDRENETFLAAQKFAFKSVRQANSANSIHVRLADHLCGFVGRMMHALMEDKSIKEDPVSEIERLGENDLVRKRLLSSDWFKLKPEHFELYQMAYRVLVHKQQSYWATMTWSYFDQVSVFYTLLRYIASYNRYEDFIKYPPELHAEYYNSACCQESERAYELFN